MTTPSDPSEVRHPVEQLAEEFVTRIRRGDRPSLTEYVKQWPEIADELADIIEALLLLEDLGAEDGAAKAAPLPVPERLGEYKIVREIGRGGMGVVFEAEQFELGRRVALKVLPTAALLRPTHLERFRREARAAGRLHHTNIIPIYGVGSQDGIHYFAMQYISGRGLDVFLKEAQAQRASPSAGTTPDARSSTLLTGSGQTGGSPRYRRVAEIGLQIADAVAHAHSHGVLHRDIKPANVVLDEQGTAWLGDFGLAQLADDAPLTSTGGFVGTLRYLAPERLHGDGNERSDIYSLGATLYELTTLQPIFDESDRARLLRQVEQVEPTPPRRIDRHTPQDLETIILKSIAKDPADRYASAQALSEDLRRYLADRPLLVRRPSQWELIRRWIRRNPLTAGLLATIFVCLAGGLAATFWQWRRAETNLIAKNIALVQAQQSAQVADEQKVRAQAHGRRAYLMLERLMFELSKAPEGQPGAFTHRTLLQVALKIHQDFLKETISDSVERADVARLAILAGDLNAELRDVGQAEKYFQMAIDLVEPEASDSGSPAIWRELKARALGNCGGLLRTVSSRSDDAEKMLSQSLTLFRELSSANPAERTYRRNISVVLRNLALKTRLHGQSDKALPLSLEAVELCKTLMIEDPNDWAIQSILVQQYSSLAAHHEILKQWTQARTFAALGRELGKDLVDKSPRNVSFQESYSECESIWGQVLVSEGAAVSGKDRQAARQCYEEAEGHLRAALETRERLFNANRSSAGNRSRLATALNNLGFVLTRLNRFDEAERYLIRAVDEQKEVVRVQPNNAAYVRLLVHHYRSLGGNHCRAGRHAQTAELIPTLITLQTGNGYECVAAARLLTICALEVEKDPSLEAATRKNLAERYTQQALDQLRLAISRGYRERHALESSIDLKPLRPRPAFQELIKNLPAKSSTPDDRID